MFRKLICLFTAAVLLVTTAGLAAAEEKREGIRFSHTEAEALRAEISEQQMAEAKKQGLEKPLTEEALGAAGARIDREDGIIYMIRGGEGLGEARTAQEAAAAAWSLAGMLGGTEEMELELYARLSIGDTSAWCFRQVREEEVVYGRMLKILCGTDGKVNTVISSLGFPEETDESLGVEEDLLGQMILEAETPEIPDFAKMVRGEWTGEAEVSPGEKREITVPVMQDPDTGLWYLGDPERKIVLGSFRTMVLDGKKDCLLTSAENSGWDSGDLLVYFRLIQSWDYYARMGWIGPDGVGTPVLVLGDLCMVNGETLENACYMGILQDRWQAFGYTGETGFGRCLDVLAHEYAHCVTETSIGQGGLYKDDYGAINEAMSDILGNICEAEMKETADTAWSVGENLGVSFRSMTDPHAYGQPEYVGDIYYASGALYPNEINDRGGVHANSSILNYTASRLCTEGGMTLAEARDFWMTVDLGLSSRTDYPQMASLMEWALQAAGLEKYALAVEKLVRDTRMTEKGRPDPLPQGQMLAELAVPDTEALKDHGWILMAIQIRPGEAMNLALQLMDGMLSGGEGEEPGFLATLEGLAGGETSETEWSTPEMLKMQEELNKVFTSHTTWKSAEGQPWTLVLERGLPTIYALANVDPNTVEFRNMALLVGQEWLSMDPDEAENMDETRAMDLLKNLGSLSMSLLLPEDTDKKVLPTAGLEKLTVEVKVPEEEPEAKE